MQVFGVFAVGYFYVLRFDRKQILDDLTWAYTYSSNLQPIFQKLGYWDQVINQLAQLIITVFMTIKNLALDLPIFCTCLVSRSGITILSYCTIYHEIKKQNKPQGGSLFCQKGYWD